MALEKYTLVQYDGIDIGAIYLGDVGKRPQLGGGEQFELGQDKVINPGDVIALVNTGDVLMSSEEGKLKEFGPTGAGGQGCFTLSQVADPSGLTGTQGLYRSGVTGPDKKVDPVNTTGDF